MSSNQRLYNKLYVNKNREEGSSNLILGYKQNIKELVLKKDKDTYFQIPAFSDSVSIHDAKLIENGAIGGPFPAASDRLFKNQENYGNYTPYGTSKSTPSDGMWFCSWLYYDPVSKQSRWLDRFYNPGKFSYNQALKELNVVPTYEPTNFAFVDLPSTMVFEQGVLYKYYHLGERSFQHLLTTLAGASAEHLILNLSNWTDTNNINTTQNSPNIRLTTNGSLNSVVSKNEDLKANRIFPETLNFDNSYSTQALVDFDDFYNFENEFTWSLWANSENWQNNRYAQIIGNYSSRGDGISISIEDNTATPVLIIPETYYGHLLFINERGEGFLDKSVQDNSARVSPSVFAIDEEGKAIVCNVGQLGTMYKVDHTGEILASTKNYLDEETLFAFISPDEDAKQIICGENQTVYMLTNKALYEFDSELRLQKQIPISYNDTVAAFSYNSQQHTATLELVNSVYDAKFIENTLWSTRKQIGLSGIRTLQDGHLYKNGELFQTFEDQATLFAIDPNNKIWVLHGENQLSVINTTGESEKAVEFTLQIGSLIKPGQTRKKQINFVNQYSRETGITNTLCVVYYSDERILYFYNLDGTLSSLSYINELFNSNIIEKRSQQYDNFQLTAVGDFTGYEHKRVFKNNQLFKNKKQLVLRIGLKDNNRNFSVYKLHKLTTSIEDWENQSWHHILFTLKNKKFTLLLDGVEKLSLSYTGQYKLSFENQSSLMVGSSLGNKEGFNTEIQYTSNMFNGRIGDVRIYNYAVNSNTIDFFLRSTIVAEDMLWPYPTPSIQYMEEIQKLYKHKLPGAKSQFFNIKLAGTQITDPGTRALIETELRSFIEELKPSHADLLKINWID